MKIENIICLIHGQKIQAQYRDRLRNHQLRIGIARLTLPRLIGDCVACPQGSGSLVYIMACCWF